MPEGCAEYDNCPICLERISDKCYLPCNHMFCKTCIIRVHLMIQNNLCPVCRYPTKLTEIKSMETNSSLFRLNNLKIRGSVYVQGNEVGLASYHFDSDTDCYISFASPCCLLSPSLDNGERPPSRKPFVNFDIDEENRIFRGEVHWVPTSWQGNVCWVYRMHFSEDYEEIIAGTLVKYDSISKTNILGIVEFGFKLRYRRLHSNDLKKLLGPELPSLYEVL